ncbi:Uncharacterised protein [Acinetobacter baumannii]|nr:Uncharacterised protein [Acinetobacter baumannii]
MQQSLSFLELSILKKQIKSRKLNSSIKLNKFRKNSLVFVLITGSDPEKYKYTLSSFNNLNFKFETILFITVLLISFGKLNFKKSVFVISQFILPVVPFHKGLINSLISSVKCNGIFEKNQSHIFYKTLQYL